MTRLKRITNKIFGNTASTTGSSDTGPEIGQFGSAKAGTYNATADVETIQALPAYEQGWIGAVIPDQQYPTLPEMTGVNKVLSYQTGYLMQEGIPEWDSGTTYYKNSIVKYAKVTTTQTTTVSIGASTGITSASVNKNTFVSQISVDGNYTFTYNGTSWLYNDIATDLNIYGITYTGTPAENDTITVTLTTTTSIGDLTLYISLTDDNINHNPLTDTTYWKEFGLGGGSGLEICDIGMALYVDETKGLRRYLNGQIVDINTNTQAFLDRLKEITTLHPSLLCTEEEWQSAKTMSAFGQVGKFVFNYSGGEVVSVRIPRVVNVQGLFDLQNLGMTVDESLPNIKGFVGQTGYDSIPSGAFYSTTMSGFYASGSFTFHDTRFDASLSSSIYQDNAHVQQEAIQYPYFIQIATGSETENNIINEIELNNPYSLFDSKYSDHELNNLSWLKSEGQWNAKAVYTDAYDKLLKVYNGTETVEGLSVKLSTETYTDYDFVLNTAEETFRLPIKTKLASGKAVVGNGIALGLTNGSDNGGLVIRHNDTNGSRLGGNKKSYGSSVGTTASNSGYNNELMSLGVTPDPTKSGIELSDSGLYLYFYVGETVQNANLIDAGRIGEQLASHTAQVHIIDTYVNGTSGYRTWSDGYCEQWGKHGAVGKDSTLVITLLKPYKDTNYMIFEMPYFTNTTDNIRAGCGYNNKTTSSFTLVQDTYEVDGGNWFTCGYIA